MLKLAYIFLLVYFNLSSASAILKLNSDTTKIVYIKVIVREKPITLEDSSDTDIANTNLSSSTDITESTSSNHITNNNLSNKSPSFKSLASTKTNPVRLPKKLRLEITNSELQLKENKLNFQPLSEKEAFDQIRSPQKNKYLFISLLIIITGTVVALFYRSGIPLIFAILLMITGYYLFIYALLFMV